MEKNEFDNLIKERLNNVEEVGYSRILKLENLLDIVQHKLINSINTKTANAEVLKLNFQLNEVSYIKYFGIEESFKSQKCFINLCANYGIDCRIYHRVKSNARFYNSYYDVFIEYKIPNNIKKLTLK